ncbi:MAG TPA: hypothetical protein VGF40_10740 [Thermoanaerobaculia bacterium]
MSNRVRSLVLPLVALALLALPAAGTVARVVSFEEKVDAADAIVLGRIVATESAWDPTHRWILTRSTLQVEKALRGTPAPQLTLVTPGGTVDGVRQETVGIPSFSKGDEHVVFVRSTAAGPTVAFFEQGLFDVARDARGAVMVQPASSELILLDPTGRRSTAATRASAPETLDAFQRRIDEAARANEQRRLDMAAGAAVEPASHTPLGRFVAENRTALVIVSLALVLALGALLYKRP